mmetsp:Transcript_54412/g.161678  ORF Transcript_54412/g.161678 Transcript_54412/m.161678 type:complete len:208 (+) Transcript_54412:1370-1993(+)
MAERVRCVAKGGRFLAHVAAERVGQRQPHLQERSARPDLLRLAHKLPPHRDAERSLADAPMHLGEHCHREEQLSPLERHDMHERDRTYGGRVLQARRRQDHVLAPDRARRQDAPVADGDAALQNVQLVAGHELAGREDARLQAQRHLHLEVGAAIVQKVHVVEPARVEREHHLALQVGRHLLHQSPVHRLLLQVARLKKVLPQPRRH